MEKPFLYMPDDARDGTQKQGCVCLGLGRQLSHNLGSRKVPNDFLLQIINKASWVFYIRKRNKKVNQTLLSSLFFFTSCHSEDTSPDSYL